MYKRQFLGFHAFTGHETKLVASTPVQAPVSSPALTTPSTPTHKAVVAQTSSRAAQIASLQGQLQFAQAELSAQVDLLGVINDTNLFGQNTQVAALRIQPSTPTGGASSN